MRLNMSASLFMDRGSIYQLRRFDGIIVLYVVFSAADRESSGIEVTTLCTDDYPDGELEFHYDEATRKIYVLYDDCRALLSYDMGRRERGGPIRIPTQVFRDGEVVGTTVFGQCLYVGVMFRKTRVVEIEIVCVRLTTTMEVRHVYTINQDGMGYNLSFLGFTRVPGDAQAIDAIYMSDETLGSGQSTRTVYQWHSVRINVVKIDSAMFFRTTRGDTVEVPNGVRK
mmetsp:Transcript_17972/g.17784  ORF Transcript_17972/g.17784 Transcript_17972/m.17784 type:complete len:226 (+) Transcript_17972:3-680(+)